MNEIFISYARDDRDWAQGLAEHLETQGFSVWWDRSIASGQDFQRVIEKRLNEARCVIVIWSANSVDSDWVRAEANVARERGLLVPVSMDLAEPGLIYRHIQTADLSQWQGESDAPAFQQLVSDIRQKIEGTGHIRPSSGQSKSSPPRAQRKTRWGLIAGYAGALLLAVVVGYFLVQTLLNGGGAELKASFTAEPKSGVAPLEVTFTDTSTGDPTEREWTFGAGDPVSVKETTITHAFKEAGDHSVILKTTRKKDGAEAGWFSTANTVIPVSAPVIANFTFSPVGAYEMAFAPEQEAADGTTFQWDFGDGRTSTDATPTHEYTTARTYKVVLTVSGSGENNTRSSTDDVVVSEPGTASFRATPISGDNPLTVAFQDQSEGAEEWDWDFGDGQTTLKQNPEHVYAQPGTYDVILRIRAAGKPFESTATVVVYKTPTGSVKFPERTSRLATVGVTWETSGDVAKATLDMGDGTSSLLSTATGTKPHRYTETGTFTPKLTVVSKSGESYPISRNKITVEPQLKMVNVPDPARSLPAPFRNLPAQVTLSVSQGGTTIEVVEVSVGLNTAPLNTRIYQAPGGWKIKRIFPGKTVNFPLKTPIRAELVED